MSRFTELRVVTPARWLARDLAAGAPSNLDVMHDLGLDAPADTATTAWWMPHQFAARLAVTPNATTPALTSTGPRWLADLDRRWTRRTVWAGTLAQVGECQLVGPVFAKPAEIKLAGVPAQVWESTRQFADAAVAAGLTASSWVLISEPVEFTAEFRCFVTAGESGRPEVDAISAYLVDGQTWDAWESAADAPDSSAARAFATHVLKDADVTGPAGWVLDVGVNANVGWSVVEANAAWSSSPYHCDPAGVVAAILASQELIDPGQWAWLGDDVFTRHARPLARA